jgi:hypothetical protein
LNSLSHVFFLLASSTRVKLITISYSNLVKSFILIAISVMV